MRSVLLLEDDIPSQSAFRAVLKSIGFRVFLAGTAEAAILFCNRNPEPIDMLIADIILPGMSGIDAAVRIRAMRPGLPVLFTSGTPIEFCSDADKRSLAKLAGDSYEFLQKPFRYDGLLDSVARLLSGRTAEEGNSFAAPAN